MPDTLSQNEIDALFAQVTSGEPIVQIEDSVVKKDAKAYDFERPKKFNKEQLSSLKSIFDNYSRLLATFLTGYLRKNIEVEVISSEELTYKEFMNSISSDMAIIPILHMAPLKGSVVSMLDPYIGYAMIDKIMGGPGYGVKTLREFTEIEEILIRQIINHAIRLLPAAWENIGEFSPRIEEIVTNPQFAQIVRPNEMTALITLNIKIGNVEGALNFCLPYPTMAPIIEKLNKSSWYSKRSDEIEENYADDIGAEIEKTRVEVAAIIGRTRITVSDFVGLQKGDIIPLDSFINSDIEVMVGDLLKFHAKPGVSKGKTAVQITAHVDKEGD